MKLELVDATGNGEYPLAIPASLVRLTDFSDSEILDLISSIQTLVLEERKPLAIHNLSFISSHSCEVTFQICEEDRCLVPVGPGNEYVCFLTYGSFVGMLDILRNVADGYNWLTPGEYLDEPAFLVSKWGTW